MNLAKTSLIAGIALALCASAHAARFEAGRGIANDRATGAGPNDVTFVTRGNGNEFGWRGWDLAIGGTILPWSIPNEESSVYGLRLNLGWGAYANTYGIDAGAGSAEAAGTRREGSELQHISFRYEGAQEAVCDDLSLRIPARRSVALTRAPER